MIRKMLVIKPKRIGDSLLVTPALRAVKKKYPDMIIHLVAHVHSLAILASNSDIDRILRMTGTGQARHLLDDIANEEYDVAIELSGHAPGGRVLVECNARQKFFSTLYGRYGDRATAVEQCAELAVC